MQDNINGPEEAEKQVLLSRSSHTVECQGDIVCRDAISRRERKLPGIAQTPIRKRKTKDFKVFEPTSQKFVNESQARSLIHPSTNLPLNIKHQDHAEPKFPKFQFLNSHGPQPFTQATLSAARSHVMRHVSKEKDARRAANNHRGQDLLVTGMASGTSSEPIIIRPARGTLYKAGYDISHSLALSNPQAFATPQNLISGGCPNQEPLLHQENSGMLTFSLVRTSILPFSTQRREVELIHHYIQVFAKSSLPMSFVEESQWFNKALNDEACYHGTLFVSAAHRALLSGTADNLPQDCYRYKGEAIRIINLRLNDRYQRIEDGTIAAIACLAAYENVNGSLKIAAAHLDGLEVLGKLRGGFHSNDMPQFLEQLVHWVELCNASGLKKRARFVPQGLLNVMTPNLVVPDTDAFATIWDEQWGISAPQLTGFQMYDGMTMLKATMFHRIKQLTFIRSKVLLIRELDTDTQQRFTRNVLLIERQINAIVNRPGAKGNTGSLPIRCMPFYSSALLFVYLALREVPISSSILDNFITRLRTALGILEPERIWRDFPPSFLLWVLFIGGWAAEGRLDRPWYLSYVAWLSTQMQLEFWGEAKGVLTQYCFVDSLCEIPCRMLWDEAKRMNSVQP